MAKRSSGLAPARPIAGAPAPAKPAARAVEPKLVGALDSFESAMRALQRHDYTAARDQFQLLLASFPAERALLERVRVFMHLCERELRKTVVPPASNEERLTLATAALNDGDDVVAERLAREVLTGSPDHDLALYLMAAVRARQGNARAALEFLSHAVQVSPDISAQARHDADFIALRDLREFQNLIESPAPKSDHRVQVRQTPRRSDR